MSLGLTIQAHRMSSSEQDAKGAAAEAALIQLGFTTPTMNQQLSVSTLGTYRVENTKRKI